MDFERCTESFSNDKIVIGVENRMKFILINQQDYKIRKIQVDGCLISNDQKRCDFLFEVHRKEEISFERVYYVELKGCDVEKAFSQLASTITMPLCRERHSNTRKICYIVASRVPKAGPKIQNLKKNFTKKHGSEIHVETQKAEIKL